MPHRFPHIDHWIFDLDNVLYPAQCDLFALIDAKMAEYVGRQLGCEFDEARRIQKAYFRDHGTTLAGLMQAEGTDPHEFLDFVHDIPMERLTPAPALANAIAALPGEKLVFTNGDEPYARRVLAARGLDGLFDIVHDIHACSYRAKPSLAAYDSLIAATGIDPTRALFVEDMARNLVPAKAIGMTTVWVNNGSEFGTHEFDHDAIDLEIADLEDWLCGARAKGEVQYVG